MQTNRVMGIASLHAVTRRLRRRGNSTNGAIEERLESSPSSKTVCCVTPPPAQAEEVLARCASTSTASTASSRYSEDSECESESASTSTPLPQNLRVQGWMYWARPESHHGCFTKVYAVLRNEFLLLYPNARKSVIAGPAAATPLVQIAVARADRSPATGAFHIQDPHGDELELHLYERGDEASACEWEDALEQAVELTASHFTSFDIKVEELSRHSMYRGSLHDLRAPRSSLRQHVKSRLSRLVSFRRSAPPSSSSPSPLAWDSATEVEL